MFFVEVDGRLRGSGPLEWRNARFRTAGDTQCPADQPRAWGRLYDVSVDRRKIYLLLEDDTARAG
jgi:hypothetical protein